MRERREGKSVGLHLVMPVSLVPLVLQPRPDEQALRYTRRDAVLQGGEPLMISPTERDSLS